MFTATEPITADRTSGGAGPLVARSRVSKGEQRRTGQALANVLRLVDEPPLRKAPYNIEAEQALLGAIFINNDVMGHVIGSVGATDFFDPLHRQIFDAAQREIEAGKLVTPVTLKTFFERHEPIDATQTVPQYLGHLAANATTTINAREYAKTIRDLATRRLVIVRTEEMQDRAYELSPGSPVGEVLATDIAYLECLSDGRDGTRSLMPATAFAGLSVPPREWHVLDMIPAGTATLLFGDGGTGKSLAALQLAVCTALGRPWFDQKTRCGDAIYIGAEDDSNEMHRRLGDICRAEGATLEQLDRLHLLCLAGEDAVLGTADESNVIRPTALWLRVRRMVRTRRPALVVFDTLADFFAGNENNRAQARQFVAMLRSLAIETGCAVLLLAHPSISGMTSGAGTSGSTAWSNSVRSRLYLDRVCEGNIEPDPDARVLRTMKANYAPKGGELHMRWHQGVFLTSDACRSSGPPPRQVMADAVFLELLKTYSGQGRQVGASPSASYAPTLFARDPKARGLTRKELEGAMNRLLEDGRIRLTLSQIGPPSKRRNVLGVAT